jgi:ubiquinone biosynthesis monooxygenase Coq7
MTFDTALRSLSQTVVTASRENPAKQSELSVLTEKERKHAAGLMRVNHVGEVCAQALYEGQALTARSSDLVAALERAKIEEGDHLAWCAERLKQLNSHTSYLNPLWYTASFAMGAVAGLAGDRWSLGFVVETERQVEAHLAEHMKTLPKNDIESRAIVAQMKIDEAQHADMATDMGAAELPDWVKTIMRFKAKIMTNSAYWV